LPYFTTNFIPLDGEIETVKTESFTVYMCVVGTFAISYESVTDYKKGDTVLIPAAMKSYLLSGKASILEIYIS
jgi:mannose-6-phosphate isomerase